MARGRKPIGKKAMTGAERMRRLREKQAYEAGAIKSKISRLTRQQIRQYRNEKLERDLASAIGAAKVAYADEPKRLEAALTKLRRMAAEFLRKPATYTPEALYLSDRTAMQRLLVAKAERLGATVLPQRPQRPVAPANIRLEDGTYIAGDMNMIDALWLSRRR
jgi:hypothetical protein